MSVLRRGRERERAGDHRSAEGGRGRSEVTGGGRPPPTRNGHRLSTGSTARAVRPFRAGREHVRQDGSMANRLAHETSPYLLQHADNPVDWWPWSAEAFDEARRSG